MNLKLALERPPTDNPGSGKPLMNWLQKLPGHQRAPAGLEWALWRKLPHILAIGTAPLAALALVHTVWSDDASAATERLVRMADYAAVGLITLHWSLVLAVAIGCVIVMLMKGPAYVADAYELPHSDRPRADLPAPPGAPADPKKGPAS